MALRNKIFTTIFAIIVLAVISLMLTLSYTAACGQAPVLSDSVVTMKAITYRCYGDSQVLSLEDVEKPSVAPDEVLVKVHAAGVNPLDWHYMRGSPYIMRAMTGIGAPKDPRFGRDFAGTVESVGSTVTKFKPGDAVFGGADGAFAEYVTVRETKAIAHKPANITFEQAASVPVAAITAFQALSNEGKLKAGQKVLINGASGGVGTFAVQIAKSIGAEVTGVCSTRNVEMVLSLGADYVVNYKKEDFVQSDKRYDLIIDNVGNRTLSEYRSVLKPKGILVMIGGPKGNWVGPLKNVFNAMVVGPFIDHKLHSFLAVMYQADLSILADLMQSGKMTPVIDKRFTLSDVPEAIQYSESGRARGKIVIGL